MNYDGKSDSMVHVSHFNQSMAIYSKNKALFCKVFPSSLRPIAMRWFDGLEKSFIYRYIWWANLSIWCQIRNVQQGPKTLWLTNFHVYEGRGDYQGIFWVSGSYIMRLRDSCQYLQSGTSYQFRAKDLTHANRYQHAEIDGEGGVQDTWGWPTVGQIQVQNACSGKERSQDRPRSST